LQRTVRDKVPIHLGQRAAAELRRWAASDRLVRRRLVAAIGSFLAVGAHVSQADVVWDGQSVPITIEVTKDVPASPRYCASGQRGTLCTGAEFVVAKGQRFQMVEKLSEGECWIMFSGVRYLLQSCWWMPGFRDNQADVFVIVESQSH
jgi:hypothetical protein